MRSPLLAAALVLAPALVASGSAPARAEEPVLFGRPATSDQTAAAASRSSLVPPRGYGPSDDPYPLERRQASDAPASRGRDPGRPIGR